MKINPENLAKEITKSLAEYGQEVASEVKNATRKVAKETVTELKSTSPKSNSKRSGKYAKGWNAAVRTESATGISISVNDKEYRLVHLLEHGHAKRNGGRTKAIPHVAPAETKTNKKLEQEIIKRL